MKAQRISIDRARKARFAFATILLLASAKAFWDAQSGDVSHTLSGWLFLVGGALFLTYRNMAISHPDDPRDRQLQIQFLERQISVRQPAAVANRKSAN